MTATSPTSAATGVPVSVVIVATFSEPVTNVTQATFLVSRVGTGVSGTVTLDGATATFTPALPLLDGATFTATIASAVTDLAGNPLAASYSWSFTTATAAGVAPLANAGPDQRVAIGALVTLDGSGSADPDGGVLSYSWYFTSKPAGSGATLSDPRAPTTTFTADVDGNYVVELAVSDGTLISLPDSVFITTSTKDTAPVANAGPDQHVWTGAVVMLEGRGTDADGDALIYSWSFTSKPAGSAATLAAAGARAATFTADLDGAYEVALVVNDGMLSSAPDTVAVTASPLVSTATRLAQTGQLFSYAAEDDGALRSGIAWPSPRFVDHGDGTVTDALTGLEWLKNANCMATEYPQFDQDDVANGGVTWQHALDFVKGINAGQYPACAAGHGDWRLPNVRELRSVIDYSRYGPAIPAGHPFVNVFGYWSSTSYPDSPAAAWVVQAWMQGDVYSVGKQTWYGVWPVRTGDVAGAPAPVATTGQTTCYGTQGEVVSCAGTGQDGELQAGIAGPLPRFEVGSGDQAGCVTDRRTGLVWTRSPETVAMTWPGALQLAASFSLCGRSEWRLPNVNEIESLVNTGDALAPPWLEAQGFTNVVAGSYWSSTTSVCTWGCTSSAWCAGIPHGGVGAAPKGEALRVWLVTN